MFVSQLLSRQTDVRGGSCRGREDFYCRKSPRQCVGRSSREGPQARWPATVGFWMNHSSNLVDWQAAAREASVFGGSRLQSEESVDPGGQREGRQA